MSQPPQPDAGRARHHSSLGNRPFSIKLPVYAQSQLLLTRAITEKPKVGVNTRINAAVSGLESFGSWTPADVEGRQTQLATLAKALWDVPAATVWISAPASPA